MKAQDGVLPLSVVSFVMGIFVGCMPYVADAGVVSDRAYQLLRERVTANQTHFFVYRDADSGFNHGVPSGFFDETGSFTPGRITLDDACLDDPTALDGCSTNLAQVDQERGTILRITFAPLAPRQFAGVNFEEPINFGAEARGRGYNLTGATHLEFDVRSPTPAGFRVQFGADIAARPAVTPFMDISADWTPVSIPLNTIAPLPELTDVHVLFVVVTNAVNAPNGGTILLDNIRFTPVPTGQQNVLGLPLSTESFGLLPLKEPMPNDPIPPDQVNRNIATIHDASLTALAMFARGTEDDLQQARLIVETLSYALQHDNRGAPLPIAADGSTGLHNAYKNGDIALFNDQAVALQGDVQFAGFSVSNDLCGPARFCLILDGATGGNNAFAMLAFLTAYRQLNDARYLEDARRIGRWIVDQLTDTTGSSFGGYYVGFEDGGILPRPVNRGKSTENNAVIFSAFSALAAIEQELGNTAEAETWMNRATVAGDFIIRIYNPATGCFDVGTFIDPATGKEMINSLLFLDAQTIPILALATVPRYQSLIDWKRPLQCILGNLAQSVAVGGLNFYGFHLTQPSPPAIPLGIAWEFTAQTLVAMQVIDRLFQENNFADQIQEIVAQLDQAQQFAPFTDGLGLIGSTRPEEPPLPPHEHCLPTPFQCIPSRVGLAATNWAIFADQGLNPFPANPLTPPQTQSLITESISGGCAVNPGATFDPIWLGLLGSPLVFLVLRHMRGKRFKRPQR